MTKISTATIDFNNKVIPIMIANAITLFSQKRVVLPYELKAIDPKTAPPASKVAWYLRKLGFNILAKSFGKEVIEYEFVSFLPAVAIAEMCAHMKGIDFSSVGVVFEPKADEPKADEVVEEQAVEEQVTETVEQTVEPKLSKNERRRLARAAAAKAAATSDEAEAA